MRALERTWHPEHFFCTLCGKHFGPEGFHEKDGKAFCRECYYEKFAPRCKRCEKAIMEGYVTALTAQWHPECFSCKVGGGGGRGGGRVGRWLLLQGEGGERRREGGRWLLLQGEGGRERRREGGEVVPSAR